MEELSEVELKEFFEALLKRKLIYLDKVQFDPYLGYLHGREEEIFKNMGDFPAHLVNGYTTLYG